MPALQIWDKLMSLPAKDVAKALETLTGEPTPQAEIKNRVFQLSMEQLKGLAELLF